MKKLRLTTVAVLLALLASLFAPAALAVDEPQIDSTYAAILMAEDGDNESLVYAKNERERMYPASLTKVMTVLLALEAVENGSASLSDMVTAQEGFDFDMLIGGTTANIVAGETMSLQNLLYCAMIASANEACNVIAMHISGSVSAFVERMNQRATQLGCTDTHFVNTHGLPSPEHFTTCWDFSRILREAVRHDFFMEICSTLNYVVPDTNMSAERRLENTNSLINPTNALYPGDWGYEYARGVKTGHTSDAGYCLASSAVKDGVTLISVVMKCEAWQKDDGSWYYGHFADTRTLFQWAFANYSYQEIVRASEVVGEVAVEMGSDADSVSVRPSSSITAYLPNDIDISTFERSITFLPEADGKALLAPVEAGRKVGEISVSLNGTVYGTAPLVTSTSVDLSRTQYMRDQMAETLRQPGVVFTFWGLTCLFLLYLLLVIRYRAKRRAYQKRLEAARQIRLDLEEEEDKIHYERRARSGGGSKPSPGKVEVVLEPESARREETAEAETEKDAADEPTRVEPVTGSDEPTRPTPPLAGPTPSQAEREYFKEFFGKK